MQFTVDTATGMLMAFPDLPPPLMHLRFGQMEYDLNVKKTVIPS